MNLKGASVEGMHGPPRDMSSDRRAFGPDRAAGRRPPGFAQPRHTTRAPGTAPLGSQGRPEGVVSPLNSLALGARVLRSLISKFEERFSSFAYFCCKTPWGLLEPPGACLGLLGTLWQGMNKVRFHGFPSCPYSIYRCNSRVSKRSPVWGLALESFK